MKWNDKIKSYRNINSQPDIWLYNTQYAPTIDFNVTITLTKLKMIKCPLTKKDRINFGLIIKQKNELISIDDSNSYDQPPNLYIELNKHITIHVTQLCLHWTQNKSPSVKTGYRIESCNFLLILTISPLPKVKISIYMGQEKLQAGKKFSPFWV